MFTNFLLCCCHACRCSKNVVIVDFNWLIVLSVFIVSLVASLVAVLYYRYRQKELEIFVNYRKNNDNNTDSANLQKKMCIFAKFCKCVKSSQNK